MASRRDLFQSYQFMVQRVVSGLVLRETDPAQTPMRRMGGAAFAGVMVAVLSLAVAGVIGFVSPGGNTTWQTAGKVIVEEETGARYVWIQDEDKVFRLHPVVNFPSAALIVGTREVIEVSAASLADAPRGPRLGIANGPDSIPTAEDLLPAPWTLCSLPAETRSGEKVPNTSLVLGQGTTRGTAVGDAAVLIRDIDTDTLHLVWRGYQYPVRDEDAVVGGLALGSVPTVEVGTAWLSALPAGDPLGPRTLAGLGGASSAYAGAKVGQVAVVSAGGLQQYYLVQKSSLVAITEVQAQIQLASATTRAEVYDGKAPAARKLSASDANLAEQVPLPDPAPTDPPSTVPDFAPVSSTESTVCASFAGAQGLARVSVEAASQGAQAPAATSEQTQAGTVLANRVQVAPGRGALVQASASSTDASGAIYLVADDGLRYAVANSDALRALGYADVTPVRMPASLVNRIPAGPALSPAAAGQYA